MKNVRARPKIGGPRPAMLGTYLETTIEAVIPGFIFE
jgi:hypothetical protein